MAIVVDYVFFRRFRRYESQATGEYGSEAGEEVGEPANKANR